MHVFLLCGISLSTCMHVCMFMHTRMRMYLSVCACAYMCIEHNQEHDKAQWMDGWYV